MYATTKYEYVIAHRQIIGCQLTTALLAWWPLSLVDRLTFFFIQLGRQLIETASNRTLVEATTEELI